MFGEVGLTSAIKWLRASQPFNAAATTALRAVLPAAGGARDFARRHLPRMGTVRATLPNGKGLVLWSRGDDGVANDLYWGGFAGYEPDTAPTFWRLATRAQVTLDVGAHVGFYALLAALANPAGRVYAFEPLPRVHERLRRNLALNRAANVEPIAAAVSDREGEVEFFSLDVGTVPSSSSLSRDFMETTQAVYAAPLVATRVRTLTLDAFVRERAIARVDLVKLDIETGEPAALRGMRETLARDRPALICEVLPNARVDEIDAVVRPLGYRYFRLAPEGQIAEPALRAVDGYCNYLVTV